MKAYPGDAERLIAPIGGAELKTGNRRLSSEWAQFSVICALVFAARLFCSTRWLCVILETRHRISMIGAVGVGSNCRLPVGCG